MHYCAFVLLLLGADPAPSVAIDRDRVAVEGNWTSFRDGGSSSLSTSHVPSDWGPDAIRWEVELPGYGQSSPVLFDGRLYLIAVEGDRKQTLVALAIDAATGEAIWRRDFPASATAPSNYAVARAAPTPTVDADGVYLFFESGDVLALSHAGETLWERSLTKEFGPFENHHGVGASPAEDDDSLFLNVQHDGPSYLLALDKRTGRTRWKIDRPSSKCWTSPVVGELAGRRQVIVSASGAVDAYDAATGEALWSVDGLAGNSIASPTIAGDRVYVGADLSDFAPVEDVLQSNRCLEISRVGDEFRAETVWTGSRALAHYASPLVHAGHAWFLTKQGVLHCLDAETGESRYVERLGQPCWCTPIAAGERLFVFHKDGSASAIRAGGKFEALGIARLWDPGNAPSPETYREFHESSAGQGGEERGGEAKSGDGTSGAGRSGNSFFESLWESDANADGTLTADELSGRGSQLLTTGDTDGDGALSRSEVDAIAKAFVERRRDARGDSADPIVYGVAAAENAFFVRTGTRLYGIFAP